MLRILFIALLSLTYSANSTPAAPLTKEAVKFIDDEIIAASRETSLARCRSAEQVASQYDRDPYHDGLIAFCFGIVESRSKNKHAACSHLARTIDRLGAVPMEHPHFEGVKAGIMLSIEEREALNCS